MGRQRCLWSQKSVQTGTVAAGEGQHRISTWGASQQIPEPRNTLPADDLTATTNGNDRWPDVLADRMQANGLGNPAGNLRAPLIPGGE
jgi:hypothetical protein